MAGGITSLQTTNDVSRIEAPVTWKAYLMCAFASFGGIFFGYDSGYISGVLAQSRFITVIEGPGVQTLTVPHTSLITSILSAGTFFGALIAGDVSDRIGRKWTVIMGCIIYGIGVIIQVVTGPEVDALATIIAGRTIAGIGAGFESAIVILYLSEIVSRCASCRTVSANMPCPEPQENSWSCRLWISICHHNWTSARCLRELRNKELHQLRSLSYSNCPAACLGPHSWSWTCVPP